MIASFKFCILLCSILLIEGFVFGRGQNDPVKFHNPPPSQHCPFTPLSKNLDDVSSLSWKAVRNDRSAVDLKTSDLFSLNSIRSTLVRQEETIIFALIERAQYRRNLDIYDPNFTKLTDEVGNSISFFEWMMIETEKLHARVRRYTSPEEHPFFEKLLPAPILPSIEYPELLMVKKSDVNVNPEILRWYIKKIINRLCVEGDDEQHGSSIITDINALQAISRRIHTGKFVAETKYQAESEAFNELVEKNDVPGVIEKLTNIEVERSVLRRAFVKAYHYGRDITGTFEGSKIDPMLIVEIYRDMIIPFTKDVEIRYIFHRVGKQPPPAESYFELCRGSMDAFKDLDAIRKYFVPVAPEIDSSTFPL